jgi:HrpA-like RNA helicase
MDIIKENINDILDSSAQHNNFLTNQPYSDNFKVLAKKWSQLPLYTSKDKIMEFMTLLDTKQVILLISGTGSGKTVLVPKFVLKYLFIE